MSRTRLGVSAVLCFALAAFVVAQEPKAPQKDPPKVDPKAPQKDPPKVDPKAPQKVDPKTQPPAPADGKTFGIGFAKDKKMYSEVATSVTQIVKVQGQDLTQKQDSTFWYEWTPVELKDGKWTVKQRVDGLKMNIDISGNLISYDSTKTDSPALANPGLNEFFKKLGTAEFDVILDKNFRVEKVEGKEKFIGSIAGGNQQMDTLLKKVLTDDALKDMCDPSLKIVPDAPKKAGESWTRSAPLNLGPIGKYKVDYKFTYVGPAPEADKKDLDKIDVEATMSYEAPPKDGPEGAGLLFRITGGKLNNDGGPAKGVIYYNTKAQRPESAEVNLKLKGELTVNVGGADTKVDLEMTQKTVVKYGDASLKPGVVPPKP